MEEIWKDIYEYDGVNYQGKYQISNYGNVRSKDRIVNSSRGQTYFRSGKSIKPFYSCKYLRIRLYDGKTPHTKSIHRIVATYFLQNTNPEIFKEVNHIDGNRLNNNADNLEWCSRQYNMACYFEKHPEARKMSEAKKAACLLKTKNSKQHNEHKYCSVCGKEASLKSKTNLCPSCYDKAMTSPNRRKVLHPTREDLKNDIRIGNFKAVADKYRVSDNAIRKWCKQYGLPYESFKIRKMTDEEWAKI